MGAPNLSMSHPQKIHCRSKVLDLSQPQIMGIINLSPESFCAEGLCNSVDEALQYCDRAIQQGAAIMDIGAEPTNPRTRAKVTVQEQIDVLVPVVEALSDAFPIPFSVDTSKPDVMSAALDVGACMINDVRGLREPGALEVAARAGVPICIMHMKHPFGRQNELESDTNEDIIMQLKRFFAERIEDAVKAGIKQQNILLDPGIGYGNFGKDVQENSRLVNELDSFLDLGRPLVVGLSRKFGGKLLGLPVEKRLASSLAATIIAVERGARLIRTHDIKPTFEAIRVAQSILGE